MSRYAEAYKHENLNGEGDSRPTALQVIEDENRVGDLSGKVVVITGCSSGLGTATAQAMATTGATLYLTARNLDRARDALGPLLKSDHVHLVQADLTHLASVKALADEIKSREKQVSIMINNAGVMQPPQREVTTDGFELHIGTNHLAHFYLFNELKDLLLAGSTPEFQSRVVNVSSMGHRSSTVLLDDINVEKNYDPLTAYASSKTANIWMANQIERLYGSSSSSPGIHGYSSNPGAAWTPLQKNVQAEVEWVKKNSPSTLRSIRSLEQGAAPAVWAAVARELEGRGGLYLENCAVAVKAAEGLDELGEDRLQYGYATWAYDEAGEKKLWDMSLEMTGL